MLHFRLSSAPFASLPLKALFDTGLQSHLPDQTQHRNLSSRQDGYHNLYRWISCLTSCEHRTVERTLRSVFAEVSYPITYYQNKHQTPQTS